MLYKVQVNFSLTTLGSNPRKPSTKVVNCVVLCIVLCKCVLCHCHRVPTQLQLTNISNTSISNIPTDTRLSLAYFTQTNPDVLVTVLVHETHIYLIWFVKKMLSTRIRRTQNPILHKKLHIFQQRIQFECWECC
jgi:hypothetical protein